ncbi:MAG: 50S ribosomal protein L15 [Desulfatibacillaceae bacterium]
MKLNELRPAKGAKKPRKRLGRGPASGRGTFAGKGCKGQNARSGGGVKPGFEGGQMPIQRRLPKRGFTNIFRKEFATINVRDLARFESGAVVDAESLRAVGLIKSRAKLVKLLGHGDVSVALTVKVHKWTESAREKVEKAGGSIEAV